jgi:hypothetical protein
VGWRARGAGGGVGAALLFGGREGRGALSPELAVQRQWRVVEEACVCLMTRNKMEKGSSTGEEMGRGPSIVRQQHASARHGR